MRILIITGGSSSEREISLMSAKNVKEGLEEKGHHVKIFDFKKGKDKLKKLVKEVDIVFPVLHGEEGEGGSLQLFLSKLKVPFVGGDPKGYKKGWFKIPFKIWCEKNNIPTSEWKKIQTIKDIINFGFPSVLKSSAGGSSKEVVILKSSQDLKNPLLKKLIRSKLELFIEKYLSGIEITVAILKDRALPVLKIIPPEGGWFDYKNKYSGQTKEIVFTPSVSKNIQKLAQKYALKIHKAFNLGEFSRIDFILSENIPFCLEINTIPGLTSESLVPKAAKAVDISFPDLLDKIVKMSYAKKIS